MSDSNATQLGLADIWTVMLAGLHFAGVPGFTWWVVAIPYVLSVGVLMIAGLVKFVKQ